MYSTTVLPALERVCDAVQSLGVTVVRDAGLSEWKALLARYAVVSMIAHWRCLNVVPDDITDPSGLMARLGKSSESSEQQKPELVQRAEVALRRQMQLPSGPPPAEGEPTAEALARSLNAIVRAAHRRYERDPSTGRDGIVIPEGDVLTRVDFESAFPEHVRQGLALELRSGLHSARDVIEGVPLDYGGVIDLTTCNSAILAAALKRARPDCLVVFHRFRAEFDVLLIRYRLTISLLARQPSTFLNALATVNGEIRGGILG
jgi:hypothetical protein